MKGSVIMSLNRVKDYHHRKLNGIMATNWIFCMSFDASDCVRVPVTIVCIAFFFFCTVKPVRADDCDLVVHEIASDIQDRIGARISRITTEKQVSSNPFPNKRHLSFFLEGVDFRLPQPSSAKAAENLLNSSQLQLAYAKRIIANCNTYSSVSFGMDKTGWSNVFYLFPDGSVKPRVCVADTETEERWGVGYCQMGL